MGRPCSDTGVAVHLKRGAAASALVGSGRAGEARAALGGGFEALEEASPIWLPAARQLPERLDGSAATRPPGPF